ncbi:hypothetical protein, partial [Staphylococcus capitis]|uniref:hypothetical protein n=1 Tax=Staphylococcus capitis TaxID=29388 RepID=UPI0021B16F51
FLQLEPSPITADFYYLFHLLYSNNYTYQTLIQPIQHKITNHKVNPTTPLNHLTTQFLTIFQSMQNEYIKQPAPHITHLSKRVLP